MKGRYLEVTYRKGKPMAAYLHLPHLAGMKFASTEERSEGLLVDFSSDGTALGLEITAPSSVTPAAVNAVLATLGLDALDESDLAPIAA
jgi:hypothetical protein